MDSVTGPARQHVVNVVPNSQLPHKKASNNNIALSYSSSSGYSTQSLSELDYQSSKLTLNTNKTDELSHHHSSPYYSQSSSQASLHASQLNILNPTNLCQHSTRTNASSLMSFVRTSTPTMPIDSSSFQPGTTTTATSFPQLNKNSPGSISFNPTCNSSLIPDHAIFGIAKKIDYDYYSTASSIKQPSANIDFDNDYSIANHVHYFPKPVLTNNKPTIVHQPKPLQHTSQIGLSKWANPASKLIHYVVKLFACFNIFSIIKTPNKKKQQSRADQQKATRKPTKTNHGVIELYKKRNNNNNDLNLNDSFADTASSYQRFKSGQNYVASTPIESISRRTSSHISSIESKQESGKPKQPCVVTIVKNKNSRTSDTDHIIDETETYDNVPMKGPVSGYSTLESVASMSTMSSTQIGLNINIQQPMSKYSTFVSPQTTATSHGISSTASSSASSASDSSDQCQSQSEHSMPSKEYRLSMIRLNAKSQVPNYENSDFLVGNHKSQERSQNGAKRVLIINRHRQQQQQQQMEQQRQKIRGHYSYKMRPVYDNDLLCDREVENIFNDSQESSKPVSSSFVPVVFATPNNSTGFPQVRTGGYRSQIGQKRVIVHNRGFQYSQQYHQHRQLCATGGLIGAGLVRQQSKVDESYC